MSRRAGYTLVEVLLVAALLVVVAAIAAPVLLGANERSQVRQAADKLRTSWAKARLDAIARGEPLYFQCTLGTPDFAIRNFGGATESAEVADPATAETAAAPEPDESLGEVVFNQLSVVDPATNLTTVVDAETGGTPPVVLFFPDGATSDAEALLTTSDGYQVQVTLRGLTGAAEVSDVLKQ